MGPALTRVANTPGPVTTAAHDITIIIMGPADAITTAMGLIRTTAIPRAGRPQAGVTAHPSGITRTHIGAVIPTVVTTITSRTTGKLRLSRGNGCSCATRRLGQLRYYHGAVDGVIGPQTRSAIAAFESRNGLAVDGTINRPLLDSLGLG